MALATAIENQNEKLALEIINRGANVNGKCKRSDLPLLTLAIVYNLPIVADKLIDKKADIHLRDITGTTAIWFAIYDKMEELVIKFINLGVDVESKDNLGISVMREILRYDLTEVINHLKFMYLNCLLDIINDESSKMSKCFANNGDLNIADMINDYLQIDHVEAMKI